MACTSRRLAALLYRLTFQAATRRMNRSDGDLSADLDHAPGGYLEVVGRVVGAARQANEQPVLPLRHAGFRRGPERAAREEKRSRHDVELPAELARDGERPRNVRRLHVAERERDQGKTLTDLLDLHAVLWFDGRGIGGLDGEDDVLLVQHLVVLEAVHERGRRAGRIAGQEHGRAWHVGR